MKETWFIKYYDSVTNKLIGEFDYSELIDYMDRNGGNDWIINSVIAIHDDGRTYTIISSETKGQIYKTYSTRITIVICRENK